MIAELVARGFRNLEDLEWSLEPGCHLLVGGTGAGKTSLLESIYLVSTTRSFRTRQLGDCLRRDALNEPVAREGADRAGESAPEASGFFVAANLSGAERTRLEVGWDSREGPRRAVNQKPGPIAEHLEKLPLLAWSSAEVETLIGGPDLRRRLLDRGILNRKAETWEQFSRFHQALHHKRRLLREGLAGLEAWNEVLAPAAAVVAGERHRQAVALDRALDQALEASGLPYPDLRIEYRPSPPEVLDGPEALLERMNSISKSERESRRALIGPHLDRVRCLWGDLEVRQVASAGERKAFGLLLLAAQASVLREAGRDPLLLLDDLDTELDRPTLGALWRTQIGAPQTFVSSNRPEVFAGLGMDHQWRVVAGRVKEP